MRRIAVELLRKPQGEPSIHAEDAEVLFQLSARGVSVAVIGHVHTLPAVFDINLCAEIFPSILVISGNRKGCADE
jgi:hypothetical protein